MIAIVIRLATPDALDALGAFAFRFALPALVFRLIAGQPLGRSFNPIFYGGYLASGGLVFALVFAVSRILNKQTIAVAGARATTTTVGNVGFFGPPLKWCTLGVLTSGRFRAIQQNRGNLNKCANR